MGVVAKNALKNNGTVLGITTPAIMGLEKPLKGAELAVVNTVQARKDDMILLSDAFIILGGGIGTVDEAFSVLVGQQVGEHKKPIIFVNTNNFYNDLFEFIDVLDAHGFISDLTKKRLHITVAQDSKQAVDIINNLNKKGSKNAAKRKIIKTKK
ncbi:MAG: LOG family protein, partial [Rickettsiales bacterium]|jgi:uncharacterized protein (TIGR00730 family)|nr:LOG family protein [Rickettsiales bacterium]